MDNINSLDDLTGGRHAVFNALLLLFLAIFGFIIVGPIIGLLFAIPFYPGSISDIANSILNPMNDPNGKQVLYFMQAGATFGMFLIPALYVKVKMHLPLNTFISKKLSLVGMLIAGVITITFMGVNSIVIEWNANLHLPEFMSAFENWAVEKEKLAEQMTNFLATFDSGFQFIAALIIMAALPAIAEEFAFRGLVQNRLSKGFNNPHLAIWISAFLFSAIHMQFFGFVPRMLLGALFGYLYLWSGNLLVPIFAHFVNNGFTLSMMYFYNEELVTYDIQNSEAPTLSTVLIFAIITFTLLYYFRKLYLNLNSNNGTMAKGV
jgi:membrane protease YdiL (CAAX protease family)